jgi:presenilin-like A22 family membrane protease
MKYFSNLVLLCSTYLLTILLGLNTAAFILPLMYPPPGVEPTINPVVSEPESVNSSLQIFIYVLAMTAVMLFLLKKKWGLIIKIALLSSFLFGTFLTSASIIGDSSIIFTILLLILIIWKRDSIVLTNLMLVFTISGIGALLGSSLGFIPALAFILLMSLYDIIAVFVTKHMVTLAEESKGKFAFMFLIPVGERTMGLGAGDIAMPLTFTVSVMASHGAGYAIPTAYGGLLGLTWLFYYLEGKEKVALPALPPITIGLLTGYLMCKLILG